jgi:hypothetical protein
MRHGAVPASLSALSLHLAAAQLPSVAYLVGGRRVPDRGLIEFLEGVLPPADTRYAMPG